MIVLTSILPDERSIYLFISLFITITLHKTYHQYLIDIKLIVFFLYIANITFFFINLNKYKLINFDINAV